MQQQQVELLDAQLAHPFVERVKCFIVAVVADPDFGLDEYFLLGIPERRMPSPTSRSLAYAAAVSISR